MLKIDRILKCFVFVIIKTLRLYVSLFDIEGSLIQLLRLQIATWALKGILQGFPCGLVVANHSLIMQGTPVRSPVKGRSPYAAEQQSLCTATTEPQCCSYGNLHAQSLCSPQHEAFPSQSDAMS